MTDRIEAVVINGASSGTGNDASGGFVDSIT
jgi:hypothetical protein